MTLLDGFGEPGQSLATSLINLLPSVDEESKGGPKAAGAGPSEDLDSTILDVTATDMTANDATANEPRAAASVPDPSGPREAETHTPVPAAWSSPSPPARKRKKAKKAKKSRSTSKSAKVAADSAATAPRNPSSAVSPLPERSGDAASNSTRRRRRGPQGVAPTPPAPPARKVAAPNPASSREQPKVLGANAVRAPKPMRAGASPFVAPRHWGLPIAQILAALVKVDDPDSLRAALDRDPGRLLALRDSRGRGLLHWASARNRPRLIRTLISAYDARTDCTDDGRNGGYDCTPLHYAASGGFQDCIRVLAEHGADVNSPDVNSGTPLHWACQRGKLTSVKVLLALGADDCRKDVYGATPMYCAYEKGHTRTVRYMQERGLDGPSSPFEVVRIVGEPYPLGWNPRKRPMRADVQRARGELVATSNYVTFLPRPEAAHDTDAEAKVEPKAETAGDDGSEVDGPGAAAAKQPPPSEAKGGGSKARKSPAKRSTRPGNKVVRKPKSGAKKRTASVGGGAAKRTALARKKKRLGAKKKTRTKVTRPRTARKTPLRKRKVATKSKGRETKGASTRKTAAGAKKKSSGTRTKSPLARAKSPLAAKLSSAKAGPKLPTSPKVDNTSSTSTSTVPSELRCVWKLASVCAVHIDQSSSFLFKFELSEGKKDLLFASGERETVCSKIIEYIRKPAARRRVGLLERSSPTAKASSAESRGQDSTQRINAGIEVLGLATQIVNKFKNKTLDGQEARVEMQRKLVAEEEDLDRRAQQEMEVEAVERHEAQRKIEAERKRAAEQQKWAAAAARREREYEINVISDSSAANATGSPYDGDVRGRAAEAKRSSSSIKMSPYSVGAAQIERDFAEQSYIPPSASGRPDAKRESKRATKSSQRRRRKKRGSTGNDDGGDVGAVCMMEDVVADEQVVARRGAGSAPPRRAPPLSAAGSRYGESQLDLADYDDGEASVEAIVSVPGIGGAGDGADASGMNRLGVLGGGGRGGASKMSSSMASIGRSVHDLLPLGDMDLGSLKKKSRGRGLFGARWQVRLFRLDLKGMLSWGKKNERTFRTGKIRGLEMDPRAATDFQFIVKFTDGSRMELRAPSFDSYNHSTTCIKDVLIEIEAEKERELKQAARRDRAKMGTVG